MFVRYLASELQQNPALADRLRDEAAIRAYVENMIAQHHGSVPVITEMKKCVVLDCDGVLWDGTAGEDGVDGIRLTPAHLTLQNKMRELKERGIILALNSKNNMRDVEAVFAGHPEMPIKLSDFSAVKINWDDKARNMRELAKELSIGIGSFVFIDDSPQERDLVKAVYPEVFTPDLPEDPGARLSVLDDLVGVFPVTIVTAEDRQRTKYYKDIKRREGLKEYSLSLDDFYRSLGMRAIIREGGQNMPYVARIAQLTQRTNQFNLRLRRYSETDIIRLLQDPKYKIFTIELADRFGDSGIVGVVMLEDYGYYSTAKYASFFGDVPEAKTALIDTFCLSCRAIGLNVESTLLGFVTDKLKKEGFGQIMGVYNKGEKNVLVQDLYEKYGFEYYNPHQLSNEEFTSWMLDLSASKIDMPRYIQVSKPSYPGAAIKMSEEDLLYWLEKNSSLYVNSTGDAFMSSTVETKNYEELKTFLPELKRICNNDDRFSLALYIELALALFASDVEILRAEHSDEYCEDYDIYFGTLFTAENHGSVLKKILEIMGSEDDLVRFIDRWGPICMHRHKNIAKSLPRYQPASFLQKIARQEGLESLGFIDYSHFPDADNATALLSDLLYSHLHADRIYEIKYDTSKLSRSQICVIEEYVKLLQARSSSPENIRSRPFSSTQGSKESLIAVYCTGQEFKGEGHVDVSIREGELRDYLLRITGMINIALAASNIPDKLSDEDVDEYKPLISYIKNQYRSILGEELAIPDDPKDVPKVIRRIVFGLPETMRVSLSQIEEYNRHAKEALTAA